jgi:hypothetical protein
MGPDDKIVVSRFRHDPSGLPTPSRRLVWKGGAAEWTQAWSKANNRARLWGGPTGMSPAGCLLAQEWRGPARRLRRPLVRFRREGVFGMPAASRGARSTG